MGMVRYYALMMPVLFAAVSGGAQDIFVEGCWEPGTDVTSFPNTKNHGYVSPYQSLDASGSVTFTASPQKGWAVDYWRKSSGRPFSDDYPKSQSDISGTSGLLSYTYAVPAGLSPDLYLAVKYRYLTYGITYDSAGGSTTSSQEPVSYVASVALAAAPLRTGYDFSGWRDGASSVHGAGTVVSGASFHELDAVHVDTTVRLTAQWNVKEYAVRAEATNCKITVASSATYTNALEISWSPDVQPGKSYTCTEAVVCDASGKVLKSLGTSGTGGTYRMSSDSGTYYDSVVVKVVYSASAIDYSVNLSASPAGCGSVSPVQSKVHYETEVQIVATPNGGYAFATWSDGSDASSRTLTVTNDISLTATFTNRLFTMTFDPNGDKAECDTPSKVIRYLDPIGELPDGSSTHMEYATFDGWFTAPAGGEQITSITKEGDQLYVWKTNVTLYAHWTETPAYSITATAETDPKGGVGGTCTVKGNKAGEADLYYKGSELVLTAVPNAGYSFARWMLGNTDVSVDTQYVFTVTAAQSYTAVFTGNVYTVTFYALDGVPDEQTRTVTYGGTFGDLPTAWKSDDHTLEGWYTSPKGKGKRVTSDMVMTEADDLQLFANFTPKPTYNISYNGNGATSGEMASQKAYLNEGVPLATNQFSRSGYHFLGWTNAVGTAYADCQVVTNMTSEGETAILYAAWREYTLAEAMHCTNLVWTNQKVIGKTAEYNELWKVVVGPDVGSNTSSCVRQLAKNVGVNYVLTTSIISNGQLSFYWKPTADESCIYFWMDDKEIQDNFKPDEESYASLTGQSGEWGLVSTNLVVTSGKANYIHILNYSEDATCDLDLMTWTPWGPDPEEGKDNVTVSAAGVSADGRFVLSFAADEKFDYELLTNANLTVGNWGVMEKTNGAATVTFEPLILPSWPQLLYKVRTVQKK